MSKLFKWAELPARKDIYLDKGTTEWGNHDLYPIVPKERTYGRGAFLLYWTTCGTGLSTFAIGSSYIAYGLTAGEACGGVLIGACIASATAIACGRAGAEKNLGYTMMARVSFGLRGMYLPLFFQILGNLIFFGIQSVYGGQAISLMLGAIFPQYKSLANTLPASAGTTTKDIIGFFIYIILYIPIILFIAPHKLEKFMWPAFIATVATVFGIMAWAVSANGGSPGDLVNPSLQISTSIRVFRVFQCISGVAGTYAGSADRFSDWTRFAKRKNSHVIGSIISLPIVITLCALLGVLTASATRAKYGTTMWQPLVILTFVQTNYYTAGCRAATFFAGLGIFSHQLFVNVTQNNLGAGMDLAGIFPRYISMKRGAMVLCVLGIISQPWRFLTQATVFISVISAFGIFSSVTTAILVLDYWYLRRRLWKVPDLFKGGPEYIYWYWKGINLRTWFCFIVASVPFLPGMGISIAGTTSGGAVQLYQLNYIVGFSMSAVLFLVVNYFFPPKGLGISEEFSEEAVLEGTTPSRNSSEEPSGVMSAKEASATEKVVGSDIAV